MKRICSILLLSALVALAGCSARITTSFADMDRNKRFEKSIVQTDEVCTFQLDPAMLVETGVFDFVIYEGENGKIVLSEVEMASADTNKLELHFCAYGVISSECSTIMTGCTYGKSGFLKSPITVAECRSAKYSLMTSEFEDFGNIFSVLIAFDRNIKDMDIITVTLQNLYLVKFSLV